MSFAPNDRVRIVGLKARPDLNNTWATIAVATADDKRYRVDTGTEVIALQKASVATEVTAEADVDALLDEAQAVGDVERETDALTDALASGQAAEDLVADLRIAMQAARLGRAYRAALGVEAGGDGADPFAAFDALSTGSLNALLMCLPAGAYGGTVSFSQHFTPTHDVSRLERQAFDLDDLLHRGYILTRFGRATSLETLAMLSASTEVTHATILSAEAGTLLKENPFPALPNHRPKKLDKSPFIGKPLLVLAAEANQPTAIRALVARGAHLESASDFGHQTALYSAARVGALDAVTALLSLGAARDATNRFGCASIHIAGERGHAEVIRVPFTPPTPTS